MVPPGVQFVKRAPDLGRSAVLLVILHGKAIFIALARAHVAFFVLESPTPFTCNREVFLIPSDASIITVFVKGTSVLFGATGLIGVISSISSYAAALSIQDTATWE